MMKNHSFILAFFLKNSCYNITHNCVYLHCASSPECFILFLRSPHLIAPLRQRVCFHCTWYWWAKCGDRETIHSRVLKDKASETFIVRLATLMTRNLFLPAPTVCSLLSDENLQLRISIFTASWTPRARDLK